jgi:hypothetical protein
MKAIITKYIPATNTKPSRVKAKAEGVPAVAISYGSHENPHREAALTLCRKYGWGENIIGGGMPDQTGEVFVFADPLVRAMRRLEATREAFQAGKRDGATMGAVSAAMDAVRDALEGMK